MKTQVEFNVLYGQHIETDRYICGIVNGKIKDIDAYVVELGELCRINNILRIPNRHLALDWGHFSGKEGEVIVLKEEIVRVYQ